MLALSMNANAVVVDLFEDPPAGQGVADPGGNPLGKTDSTGPYSTIVGGYRNIGVRAISGGKDNNGNKDCDKPAIGASDLCSSMSIFDGTLNFSNDPGAPGVTGIGIVEWNSQALAVDTVDGTPNINTTTFDLINQEGCNDGCDAFTFDVTFADLDFVFTLGAYTDASNFTKLTIQSEGTGSFSIPFAAFTSPVLCGAGPSENILSVACGAGNSVADFTQVGSLLLSLNIPFGADPAAAAIDITLGKIEKTPTNVPVPATLVLMGLGLAAGGLVRRRCFKAC